MLEESNETIFQMKDAMYFSFKELQLNMDNWLKSHVIYKKQSKDCPHRFNTANYTRSIPNPLYNIAYSNYSPSFTHVFNLTILLPILL